MARNSSHKGIITLCILIFTVLSFFLLCYGSPASMVEGLKELILPAAVLVLGVLIALLTKGLKAKLRVMAIVCAVLAAGTVYLFFYLQANSSWSADFCAGLHAKMTAKNANMAVLADLVVPALHIMIDLLPFVGLGALLGVLCRFYPKRSSEFYAAADLHYSYLPLAMLPSVWAYWMTNAKVSNFNFLTRLTGFSAPVQLLILTVYLFLAAYLASAVAGVLYELLDGK